MYTDAHFHTHVCAYTIPTYTPYVLSHTYTHTHMHKHIHLCMCVFTDIALVRYVCFMEQIKDTKQFTEEYIQDNRH